MAASGNGPLEPYKRPCVLRRCVELIGDNHPSKRICFLWGVVGFMALKMLLCYGDDESPQHRSILRATGHRPPQKAYSLDQEVVPDQPDTSAQDLGPLVGL